MQKLDIDTVDLNRRRAEAGPVGMPLPRHLALQRQAGTEAVEQT